MNGWLSVELMSGTTFSSGEGVAAEADTDIEQEPNGLPMVGGRRLKGLLGEECAEILTAFQGSHWRSAAERLFGTPGAEVSPGILDIDNARLPEAVRKVAMTAVGMETGGQQRLHPLQILSTLTEVRRQTRIEREAAAPAETSLRSSRVALAGLRFYAPLVWMDDPGSHEKALLAACALQLRRGGLLRNRGRGRLRCRCLDADGTDMTTNWLAPFLAEVSTP
jgi:hypothetical protein